MGEATADRQLLGSWRAVVMGAGVLLAVLLLAAGLLARDKEAVVIGTVAAVGVAATRWRRGTIGTVVVALIGADTAFWLLPAGVDNARHHDGAAAVALPLVLSVAALTATGAGIANLWAARRRAAAGRGPVVLTGVAIVGIVASLAVALAAGDNDDRLPPGGVAVGASGASFTPSTFTAETTTGAVTIALTNHDLFWHTFTIDGLGVDLRVPVGGRRQATFTAAPGTYTFYCAIPGHRSAGMEGTLVVAAG